MKTIKVASLFESLKVGGGVEKIQANLSIGLTDLGYDFTHLVLEDKLPRNEHKGTIVSLGEKFIFGFGPKKIISLFTVAWKVKQYCSKENIDILIGQGDFFYMITGLVKLLGFPGKIIGVVMTTIGIWNKVITFILRTFLGLHNMIVFLSNEEKQIFINKYGFNSNKLFTIPPSINIEKIQQLGGESISNAHFDKFTFISIGRLTYQKGQDRLIRAFYNIHTKYPDTQLIILGDGELHHTYQNLVNSLSIGDFSQDVHLLGNTENVYRYLQKSDCFVLSSNFEGFGLVIIEAMACQLPIISTNCPTGPSEIIGSLRDTETISFNEFGVTVDYKINTIENLEKAMEAIYLNNSLRISYQIKSSIRVQEYNDAVNIKKWHQLIQLLASSNNLHTHQAKK